tara:strand:- start:577 stop:1896 length:1320 start_codon:yes stop_codon:yes gene_type:complete
MENYKIIKELESNRSRLFKEEVLLREMKNNNFIFFEGLKYACNRLLTFGVKQVPESKKSGAGLFWSDFKNVLISLNSRKLTGHNARDAIFDLIEKSIKDDWNFFYRRILKKDLRCGLSEKTINNVAKKNGFDEFLIPVFQCQLAQDSEQHKKKLVGKKVIENKLDGVRVISVMSKNGNVDMFSRNGKELLNFENVKLQLKETMKLMKTEESFVLDGEIVSKNFQELMKQIYRKDTSQNSDAVLNLFDILTLKEFQIGESKESQILRKKKLEIWYEKNKSILSNVQLLNYELINLDLESGKNRFKEINNEAVLKGFEGIMIKDPNAKYECKRSFSWLKSKPVIEISLIVKKLEEGTGKHVGRLGAIKAEGNDNGKSFKISIGSGFSDQQREEFWINKDKLINQIIEIKADAITKSQDGDFWSARFPRFKTFRGFDPNEKL